MLSGEHLNIELRTAEPNDLVTLHTIRRAAILGVQVDLKPKVRDAWANRRGPDSFVERVARGEVIIASLAGEDVGWGSCEGNHVSALYVCPSFGRRGIGRTLLAKLEATVVQRGHAFVRLESTLNAVGFYAALGYAQSGALRVDGSLPMSKRL